VSLAADASVPGRIVNSRIFQPSSPLCLMTTVDAGWFGGPLWHGLGSGYQNAAVNIVSGRLGLPSGRRPGGG
jgi:hypothetical protein